MESPAKGKPYFESIAKIADVLGLSMEQLAADCEHHCRPEPSWPATRCCGTREGARRRGKGGGPRESRLFRACSEYPIVKRGAPTEEALTIGRCGGVQI
jgi:hypothetical protein